MRHERSSNRRFNITVHPVNISPHDQSKLIDAGRLDPFMRPERSAI
jgi:hypothetical protein